MKKLFSFLVFLLIVFISQSQAIQKYWPVNFSRVTITDNFWKPKLDLVADKTLKACIYQTEIKTPRIRNFIKIVNKTGEKHEGIYYDDSDVYKALEAMAYSLKNHPDTSVENTADRWINWIAGAQMEDGYVDTYFQLRDISKRWTEIEKHEDYCAGHLIEAAIAYYNATGKRKLLDVAIRFANHIDSTFRLQNRYWFSGHEEIELALMKLYHLTKEERYLKLADWYLSQRGRQLRNIPNNNWITPEYWQDLKPVKEQSEITGHAVRAMYLYTGAADVAASTGDMGYVNAMKQVWEDVVYRNMYINGGIGSAGDNEGFSKDYDLPNEQAYCETCASVGMVFWNARMNQLIGDSKYIDVLERSLYNGALDGLSLSGDRFFYDNPLASSGQHQRRAWFGTACCPANISRLVASVGDYIYGQGTNSIWVNLFIGSSTTIPLAKTNVEVKMQTNYPWDGTIKLNIDPVKKSTFDLYLRIPGWASGEASPGDLYHFIDFNSTTLSLKVNGKDVAVRTENGYMIVNREWKKGDVVEYTIPMQVNKIAARNEVNDDNDRFAVQRGPLLYCVEGSDNHNDAWNFFIPQNSIFQTTAYDVLSEKVTALEADANTIQFNDASQNVQIVKKKIIAIPYYTWANRGKTPMQVWLPAKIKNIKINYSSVAGDGGNN
ncbi:MAG: glycoside hydrolase family 127 protein [Sphingobacteriales bacterium]|nr:MAG: glycoside hydrolase family 127 protein [Sphingobacteriales bacterium]